MTRYDEEDDLNTLELIGALALIAGGAVVVATFVAPKGAAVVAGGALSALGAKLLLISMSVAAGGQ